MNFTHLDLFSGIGGFALATRWAGFETVQFAEIDPFCQKVLRKNFKGVPIHDDIKTFKWTGERPFILTGGFPCQPFSCAGKRGGKEDDRFLWPEMLRIISEARPAWIIGENVSGIINMELDRCVSSLENEGYEVQPLIIPACAVNAPHRRDRVWIVANLRCGGLNKGSSPLSRQEGWGTFACNSNRNAPNPQSGEAHPAEPRGLHAESCGTDSDATNPNRFNGDDARHDAGEISQFKEAEIFRVKFDTDPGNARLQGGERPGSHGKGSAPHGSTPERDSAWSEPWLEAATRLCRVDARVSHRVDRLKSLGNAIVPQVAYAIMKAIVAIER